MGFLSFLQKKTSVTVSEIPILPQPETPDFVDTERVMELLKTPPEYRDRHWERTFYEYIPTAAFVYSIPELAVSTEGHSFIQLQAPVSGHDSKIYCICNLITDIFLEKGLGIRICSSSNEILWDFSYGDLLNFYLHKEFLTWDPSNSIQHIDMTRRIQVLKKGDEVMMAQPSEKYLPRVARNAVRKFLNESGIAKPEMMLLCRKFNNEFVQQLAFHLVSDHLTPEHHHSIMQNLTWYLPRHYSVLSFHEDCDNLKYFEKL